MINGVMRLLVCSGLLLNTYYLIILDGKITNIITELNMKVEDVDFIGFAKKIANDVNDQIENQRDRVRESLERKGIEERNSVLMHARDARMNELESK